MLRWILTYLSQAKWARNFVQNWGVARSMATRFIAGETLDEAIDTVKKLNALGINATLDHLGENVNSPEEANRAAGEIIKIIERLYKEGVSSGVSIKLSQIGLIIDETICENNLQMIYERAKTLGIFVRVDMEDSQLTQRTLDIYNRVVKEGFQNYAGIAVQAYLYRTEDDVNFLLTKDTRIRLCKGAYKEPRNIAFPKKQDVDKSFDKITMLLLDKSLAINSTLEEGGKIPPIPAIATHDQARVDLAVEYCNMIGLGKSNLEFQMLYGIREDMQSDLTKKGYPVRVYVPYGTEWYPYYVRRLAERPANLWFFLSNLIRKS
jgi:proline dehydrogenase